MYDSVLMETEETDEEPRQPGNQGAEPVPRPTSIKVKYPLFLVIGTYYRKKIRGIHSNELSAKMLKLNTRSQRRAGN